MDTSSFPVGINISYDLPEDIADIAELRADAWKFMNSWRWTPPIQDLVLAFGLGGVLGLFLVQFAPGGKPEDAERWMVVGDMPSMHFEADDYPTPELGLRLYCAIAQDWADSVLAGRDLSESYPIPVAPTREHAEMLLDRVEFIREELVLLARAEGVD